MQNIEDFVDNLMLEKGSVIDDEELYHQIRADLIVRVEDRVNSTILANMPEGMIEKFNALMQSAKSQDEIQTFIVENIPNIHDKVALTLLEFRNIYIGNDGQ